MFSNSYNLGSFQGIAFTNKPLDAQVSSRPKHIYQNCSMQISIKRFSLQTPLLRPLPEKGGGEDS